MNTQTYRAAASYQLSSTTRVVFIRATLASAGISCRRVCLCLSVRLSLVGILLKGHMQVR